MIVFYKFEKDKAIPYMGQSPYIHWLGPFSTGIYRYHSLYFRCDEPEVRAELLGQEGNLVCYIYKPVGQTSDWGQVEDVLSTSATLTPTQGDWYQLILVGKSELDGEYIIDLSLNGELYKVGCEFHGENEALSINLANKGFEVPNTISKALYNTDLYEEKPDWLVLNRKYRELLMNYMDVLANKGSYKSLINSLKWFDYDKLVELREVWKYETPDGTKMFDAPIQSMLTKEIKRNLFNCAKTTYFALRHPLKLVGTVTGPTPELVDTIYDWDELQFTDLNQHSIKNLACRWSEEEMRMKMVLLGNFFETYFLPIHSNLLRSVVEDIHIDTSLIQGFCGSDSWLEECYTEAGDFDLDWGDGQDPNRPETGGQTSGLVLSLGEVHALAGVPRTDPYACAFENTTFKDTPDHYKGLPYIPIIACHEQDEDNVSFESMDFEQFKSAYTGQIFNGIGAIGIGNFTFPEPIVSGKCESNAHGDFITTYFTEPNPAKTFTIKFLFQRPGDYTMLLSFEGQSGKHYTKRVDIKIQNNMQPDIDVYILTARNYPGEEVPNPFTANPDDAISPANRYMFGRTKPIDYKVVKGTSYRTDFTGQPSYVQYIPLCPYINSSTDTPVDAPYTTKVYTAQFTGPDCTAKMERFMNGTDDHKRKFKEGTWFRTGYENIDDHDASEWCWVQYIYKRRNATGIYPHDEADEYYNRDVFIPELMKLTTPATKEIPGCYPIVCMPTIKLYIDKDGQTTSHKVPYSYYIDESKMTSAWEFFSWNLQTNINDRLENIEEPFIAWPTNQPIPRGYYTIKFKYDFGDGPREIVKNTPFKYVYDV